MAHSSANYEMDMTTGALMPKIIRFSLPLVLSGLLQLLYNAADVVVVGRFAGPNALAAVSSTGSLFNLIVNLFMGISLGASVTVAQSYGAGEHEQVRRGVHTAITLALICGAVVTVVGVTLCRPILELMGSPDEVIDLSTIYLSIIFASSIFNMLYNFGAAILRAVGDTRRPMYYLIVSGAVNVVLNLIFVIGCHMSVAGVALATAASQLLSAVLVLNCLMHADTSIHLDFKQLCLDKEKAKRIFRIGLPAGFQGLVFSLSNVLIQSSVNSFGANAMAGNGAASNIESFVYAAMNALYTTCLTFTGQNVGAGKMKRLNKILALCELCVFTIGVVGGMGVYLLRNVLLPIYCTDPSVIEYGCIRMKIYCTTYFLCGMMDVLCGSLRGMGSTMVPMITSMLGACGLRILWILTVFAAHHTLFVLYISYPVSWSITGLAHLVCYLVVKKRMEKKMLPT